MNYKQLTKWAAIFSFLAAITTNTAYAGNAFQPEYCTDSYSGTEGIRTELGCIAIHPLYFIARIRIILIGSIGGIALLLMIIGSFFILTSQGNPERIKRGKEVLMAAVSGLLFTIFAWFILRLITGPDLLNLFV